MVPDPPLSQKTTVPGVPRRESGKPVQEVGITLEVIRHPRRRRAHDGGLASELDDHIGIGQEIEEGVAEGREVAGILEEDAGSWHDLGRMPPTPEAITPCSSNMCLGDRKPKPSARLF